MLKTRPILCYNLHWWKCTLYSNGRTGQFSCTENLEPSVNSILLHLTKHRISENQVNSTVNFANMQHIWCISVYCAIPVTSYRVCIQVGWYISFKVSFTMCHTYDISTHIMYHARGEAPMYIPQNAPTETARLNTFLPRHHFTVVDWCLHWSFFILCLLANLSQNCNEW